MDPHRIPPRNSVQPARPDAGPRSGFTMLELVAGLSLSLVMIAIAILGVTQAAGALFQSADHARLAQDAALIAGRLTRELRAVVEFSAVTPPSAGEIWYRLPDDPVWHRIYHDHTTEEITLDGEILGAGVGRFRLAYYETWDAPDPLPSDPTGGYTPGARLVDMAFALLTDDGAEVEFQTRIHLAGRENFP